MINVTNNQVREAVSRFLAEQLEKKLEPERSALEKLEPEKDATKAAEIRERIGALENKYMLENWMQEASTKMAVQLRFGTHISKGIHPDSKGDNLNFQSRSALPEGLVGSQTLPSLAMDANRNAALLPLAGFFDRWVDEAQQVRLRDVIQAGHSSLSGVFSTNPATSDEHAKRFKVALDNVLEKPVTHERNKQTLWPVGSAISENSYVTLVPLYPSAFTHQVFQKINQLRYSEENKQARDNRKKKNVEQRAYVSIPDMGVTHLGGTKPENVGYLSSKQRGRNFLLPSLAPVLVSEKTLRLGKSQDSLFGPRLAGVCRFGLNQLYDVVSERKNVVSVRDERKEALDFILVAVFKQAEHIQSTNPPGWSKDYQLAMPEKYWLDPGRAELEGEEAFQQARNSSDWQHDICERFARWVNARLQKKFPHQLIQFGDAQYTEWLREMEQAIKASQRAGREVFA